MTDREASQECRAGTEYLRVRVMGVGIIGGRKGFEQIFNAEDRFTRDICFLSEQDSNSLEDSIT